MKFRVFAPLAVGVLAACSNNDATPGGDGGAGDATVIPHSDGLPRTDAGAGSDAPASLWDAGPAPANSLCNAPQPLTLSGGKVTVSGDTFPAVNEFDSDLTCNSMLGPYPGPQVYFRVALAAGKTYKLTVAPDKFDVALYAFPGATACDAAAINAACASHVRDTPDAKPYAGKAEAMLLAPQQSADWIIAVDSYNPLEAGTFSLSVEEFTPPTNTTCAAAEAITVGQAVSGDTIGAPDEFATIACGAQPSPPSTKVPFFIGPQLYYKVNLSQGTQYRINLKPGFFARLYVFHGGAACNPTSIEAACASQSGKGAAIEVGMDGIGDLQLTPEKGGEHVVVVDSTSPLFYGPFTLQVTEQTTTTLSAPLSLDFDGDCGGLGASGDWECGKIQFSAGANCTLGSKTFGVPPTAGHSGSGMWGTVLNDCYSPLANNSKVDDKAGTCTNMNVADDSVLSFKVALPGTWTSAKLTYWSWEDVNQPFDWAEIRVDKKVAWQMCEMSYTQPTAWTQRTVDLSAHVGKTVEIGFHFMASPYVNYAGWYIDDLSISGS